MRKRIAVFICAISMENQKRHLDGILRAAKERNYLCYVFTCHLSYQASEESKEGTCRILTLPDLTEFDGAILMKNTIQYEKAAAALEEKILRAKIPAVSIDVKIGGMKCVRIDNYRAQYEVVEHLVKVHGVKNLVYLSGHPGNADSEDRKAGFYDACRDFAIPDDCHAEIVAHFASEQAREKVKAYLRSHPLPDAFVCANDQMAKGAHLAVRECGFSIPNDVAITGFDGDSIVEAFEPAITTIDKHPKEVGAEAVRMLFDVMCNSENVLTANLCTGGSCGCISQNHLLLTSFQEEYLTQKMILLHAGEFMRSMSADFAKTDNIVDFCEVLKQYIETDDGQSTFVFLCDEKAVFHRELLDDADSRSRIDLHNVNLDYTEEVTSVVAYMNGTYLPPITTSAKKVLPSDIEEQDRADYYIVVPINYLNRCFGYLVSSNSHFAKESEIFYLWLSNVEIALENIRKQILLRSLADKLGDLWVYDAMTNLYNRAGFMRFSEEYITEMKLRDASMYLLFIDLDGLKTVNDNLGHETGDHYIAAMGEIIRSTKKPKELAMRYGGDEFVLLGEGDEKTAQQVIKDMEEQMATYRFGSGNEYTLTASIGRTVCRAAEIIDLGEMIHEADERMYAEKRHWKANGKAYDNEKR